MAKFMRFSSARTGIFQLIFITAGIYLVYTGIEMLINANVERQYFFSIISIIIGVLLPLFATFIYSLKLSGHNVLFNGLTGKKYEVTIDKISRYDLKNFNLTIVDPMSMSRFSVIKFKLEEKNKTVLVLNPSSFSSYSDINKVLIENLNKFESK